MAGITPGDLVTSFDGQPVSEASLLFLLVTRSRIGETIELDVIRGLDDNPSLDTDRQPITLTVRIGRRPDEE